jgi:hypothetical protein
MEELSVIKKSRFLSILIFYFQKQYFSNPKRELSHLTVFCKLISEVLLKKPHPM